MPCYNPLSAYLHCLPDGSRKLYFSVRDLKFPVHFYTRVDLPCGRCIGCRLERSRQWAMRIVAEQQCCEASSFVTLTYADAPVSLSKRDCQLFLKRLRKRCGSFRYYLAGEYGEESGRPHYHACIFGLDFLRIAFFSGDLVPETCIRLICWLMFGASVIV